MGIFAVVGFGEANVVGCGVVGCGVVGCGVEGCGVVGCGVGSGEGCVSGSVGGHASIRM